MKNFYEILEVSSDATDEAIKKSYRRLSKKYHPDLASDKKAAAEKFKEISLAYSTLSNTALKKEYDEKLRSFAQNPNKSGAKTSHARNENFGSEVNFDINNVQKHFENFFGFDPVTKEKKAASNQAAKDKNPLDTSNVFESFFSVKRNKK